MTYIGNAKRTLRRLVIAAVLCLLLALVVSAAGIEVHLLGDGDDGNRTDAVHLMPLYDGDGIKIKTDDEQPQPFSPRHTCGRCHTYKTIKTGWHFNSADPNVAAGRPGEPWVFLDIKTRTQIPVSGRGWPGTFKPEQIGVGPWQFLKRFSSHHPGGNYGEIPDEEDPQGILKGEAAGSYQINCLTCHNADPKQDQSAAALQAALENYKWVATGSCGFAQIKGSVASLRDSFELEEKPIIVTYDKGRFDQNNQVFLDIVRKPPVHRCYFCHSTQNLAKAGQMKWTRDEDVHLAAGLTCVDCHRNGLDHNITRGYEGEGEVTLLFSVELPFQSDLDNGTTSEDLQQQFENNEIPLSQNATVSIKEKGSRWLITDNKKTYVVKKEEDRLNIYEVTKNPLAATLSCEGCHTTGRLGAPVPEHPGIPPVHFEKLTCTACHSGPWPQKKAGQVKTARIHKLGLHGGHSIDLRLPHVAAPVFVKSREGKIGPHKLFWPAFWGGMKDETVTPLAPELVRQIADDILDEGMKKTVNDWYPLRPEQILQVLKLLTEQQEQGIEAVYICGGKLYRITEGGELQASEHESARPYSWPMAHDVRGAAQSLGTGACEDCHSTDSPFFFGEVAVDSPLVSDQDAVVKMVRFEDVRPFYTKAFAFSFVFRPWLKVVALGSCALLGVVLLLYGLKALACIVKTLAGKD